MSDITFYNMWRTANAGDRARLLDRMKDEAPVLASRAGFVSITVRECAEDGRVLVEGRWRSKAAFDAAVADNPEAQQSRASLEAFGSSEPGLFTEVFKVGPPHANGEPRDGPHAVIAAGSAAVIYVQVWRMTSEENQKRWLEAMHGHIGLLTVQPGFISMSLHASLDGRTTAVYAQWADEKVLIAALSLPEAKRSHDDMARWGTPDGSLYRVDAVYLPGMPSNSQAPAAAGCPPTRVTAGPGWPKRNEGGVRMSEAENKAAISSAKIEEGRAEVNAQSIHYLRAGTGPVLVLVHGYPESSQTWRRVMPQLAKTFTVIAPDTRGVGQSSVADNFTLEEVADDIHALVRSLGFNTISLVGQDFGVQVVSAYAAKHRDEVTALVVIESPLSGFGLEELFGSFWHFGFMASPFAEMLIAGKEKEFFREFAFGAFVFRKQAFSQADIDHYISNQTQPGRLRAGLAYYRALRAGKEFFAAAVAPPWTFPVLAIDGDHTTNGLTAKSFARIAPKMKSVIATDCGHFVQEEQPEFLVKTLLDFLPRK